MICTDCKHFTVCKFINYMGNIESAINKIEIDKSMTKINIECEFFLKNEPTPKLSNIDPSIDLVSHRYLNERCME